MIYKFFKKYRIFFIVPFIIGFAGFYFVEGESLLQSAYLAITLYVMEFTDTAPNLWIEIARWLALAVTVSGVVLAMSAVAGKFTAFVAYLLGDSVAVYGPQPEKQTILSQLGHRGVDGGDSFVKAHSYILVDTEDKNFVFYTANKKKIGDAPVYIKSYTLYRKGTQDSNLNVFSPEQTASRLFWRDNCPYDAFVKNGHQLKIVIMGFDRLGQRLLTSALQKNIFHPEQSIEYHIFGEGGEYMATHPQLHNIPDPVYFYSQQWFENLETIADADMVIITQQTGQLKLAAALLSAFPQKKLHIFSNNTEPLDMLGDADRLIIFPWQQLGFDIDEIFESNTVATARQLNMRYRNYYDGEEETQENSLALWNQLDMFTRLSNISAADYHEIQKIILTVENQPTTLQDIPAGWLEQLSHLEHLRWCRYHWLNGWQYAQGKKDAEKRTHPTLVPYSYLSEAEKDKDRENVKLMFSLNK